MSFFKNGKTKRTPAAETPQRPCSLPWMLLRPWNFHYFFEAQTPSLDDFFCIFRLHYIVNAMQMNICGSKWAFRPTRG